MTAEGSMTLAALGKLFRFTSLCCGRCSKQAGGYHGVLNAHAGAGAAAETNLMWMMISAF